MIENDWKFPEPDNIEQLESAAKGLAELLTTVQESLGLLLAGVRERHGDKAYAEMQQSLGMDESAANLLVDAYRRLRQRVDQMTKATTGHALSLPQGDLVDDFPGWIGLYGDQITPTMLVNMLRPNEIEEVLPALRERLAEHELQETIDQKECCFFCGNGFNHPADPCLICADHLESGCILIGVENGETAKARADRNHMPRRTGLCFRVSRDFIRKHWPDDGKRIVDSKGYYIDESDASRLGLER